MNEPRDTTRTLSIAAAGIEAMLVFDHDRLFQWFSQHYEPFICHEVKAPFVAHIRLDRQFQPPPPQGDEVLYCHTTREFATEGCLGTIDLSHHQGDLRLSLRQPFIDVDYFVRAIFALLTFRAGGVMFHAAGIAQGGAGFLFFGHSGSGKTTVSRLSPHALVLNDDLVLLLPHEQGWMMHATPFWNSTQLCQPRPAQAPLSAMLRLVQAQEVRLERITRGQSLAEILSCIPFVSYDMAQSQRLFRLCENLIQSVPIYRLHFLPDDTFWKVLLSLL